VASLETWSLARRSHAIFSDNGHAKTSGVPHILSPATQPYNVSIGHLEDRPAYVLGKHMRKSIKSSRSPSDKE